MGARKETKISRKEIFELDWVRVVQDTIQIEGAGVAPRFVVQHIGAACILAVDANDRVLLVRQYRYPIGEMTYEVPAGKNDTWDADVAETAARELAEETPFTAESLEPVYTFYTAPGFTDEKITLYKAVNVQENSALSLDEDEFIDVCYFTKQEISSMLRNGTITDAKTIIALQYWLCEEHA